MKKLLIIFSLFAVTMTHASNENNVNTLENKSNTTMTDISYVTMTTAQLQQEVEKHYRYAFRIGSAVNRNWNERLIYRIDGDKFWPKQLHWSATHWIQYTLKYLNNKCRGK